MDVPTFDSNTCEPVEVDGIGFSIGVVCPTEPAGGKFALKPRGNATVTRANKRAADKALRGGSKK